MRSAWLARRMERRRSTRSGQHVKADRRPSHVEMLGSTGKVTWTQTADALDVTLPVNTACKYAYTLKLTAK